MTNNRNLSTDGDKPDSPSSGEVAAKADPQGFHNLDRRQVLITLGGVMLAMFLSSLDQTIVGTALPQIIADLKGFEHYTWVATAYLLTSTAMMPIVGRLTDMYGRKWFYIVGIIIFLLGSALCGLSQNMTQLILFRGFQGIGAGVMMANAFIVIGDLFPPSERGKYQGLIMAVFGLSSIIGPLLGGFITDRISWHWIFYVNLPLGIPVIAAFIRFFPSIRPVRVKHQLDYLGMSALVLCVTPLIMGLSWGGVYEWRSPHVIGSLVASAVMLVVFLVTESRAAEPIIPLGMFRNRVVSVAMAARFGIGMGMFGVIIFIPLFFQFVLGQSATNSGIILMPMMLGMVVASTLSGQIVSRFGGHYRILAIMGLAITSVGMYLMSRMTPDTHLQQGFAQHCRDGSGDGHVPATLHNRGAERRALPHHGGGHVFGAVLPVNRSGRWSGRFRFHHGQPLRLQCDGDEFIAGLPLSQDSLSELTSNPEALMDDRALAGFQARPWAFDRGEIPARDQGLPNGCNHGCLFHRYNSGGRGLCGDAVPRKRSPSGVLMARLTWSRCGPHPLVWW